MQDNEQSPKIPCILFNEECYDQLAEASNPLEQSYKIAQSLVAHGFSILPCLPYNPDVFYSEDKNLKYADKKKASGKAPVKKGPYSDLCSTLEQVTKWFHPVRGAYRGYNIGIATGECSNLFVVDFDVDPDKGIDGMAWIREQLAIHGPVNTLKVRSGGKSVNGQHWYFKHRDGFANSVSRVKGVDLRTNNGHVMAPLVRCQGVYEIIEFVDELPEIPAWLEEALHQGKNPNVAALPGQDKEINKSQEERPDIPLELVRDALSCLPIYMFDGGGIWLKIAMAIHSEFPDEDGWKLLDEWSSGKIKHKVKGQDPTGYDEQANRLRWDSFKTANNSITIGTLFWAAENGLLDNIPVGGGWKDPRRGPKILTEQEAVRIFNQSFVVIDSGRWHYDHRNYDQELLGRDPVGYVPPGTVFYTGYPLQDGDISDSRRDWMVELAPKQVYEMTAHLRVIKEVNGKPKSYTAAGVWQESIARRVARGVGYYVTDERCPPGVVNGFTGWAVKPKKGIPEVFLKHTREIICNGDDEKYSWVINRLAYVVQMGDVNIGSALVINGDQGTGKSMWWNYVCEMIGHRHAHYTSSSHTFDTRFSEELVGKFAVAADEAIFAGSPKTADTLKSLIGNPLMRDEGKGKSAKQAQNCLFFVIMSNHENPVWVSRGDRRYTLMTSSDKYSKLKREDPAVDKEARGHFDALVKELKGDGPAHLLHMLLSHKVDVGFASRALDTKEKSTAIQTQEAERDSLIEWLMASVLQESTVRPNSGSNDPYGRWGQSVRSQEFYDEYTSWVKEHAQGRHGWAAISTAEFKHRLCGLKKYETHGGYGFATKRARMGWVFVWPEHNTLVEILHGEFPELVERDLIDFDPATENDQYDPNKETDF